MLPVFCIFETLPSGEAPVMMEPFLAAEPEKYWMCDDGVGGRKYDLRGASS